MRLNILHEVKIFIMNTTNLLFQAKAFLLSVTLLLGISKSLSAQCLIGTLPNTDCNSFAVDISSFALAGVTTTNGGGCDNIVTGGTYFSTPARVVVQGQTYPFTLLSNSPLTFYAAIWVDVNNNGQFDSGEDLYNSGSTAATSFTGNITIPINSAIATVRLRIRTTGTNVMSTTDACTNFLFLGNPDMGETEDYTLTIQAAPIGLDVGSITLVTPTSPACPASSNVVIQIRNLSANPLNLATNNVTVTSSVTGPNPQIFPAVVLSSGTIPAGSNQNVTVATGYSMLNPGTYVFSSSATVAGDVNTGNDAMANVSVVVNNTPTATVSGNQTLCSGQGGSLSFSLTGGSPYSLSYSDGTNTTSVTGITSTPYVVNLSPSASTTYLVTQISNGCGTGTFSGSGILHVNPRPVISFSGTTYLCVSGQTTLSLSSGTSNTWSFTWTDGTTPTTVTGITSTPYSWNITPTTSSTYSVTAASSQGCNATTLGGTWPVFIGQNPTATLSGAGTICPGSQVNLSVTFTGVSPFSLTYTDGTTPVSLTGITSNPWVFAVSPAISSTYSISSLSDACAAGTPIGSASVTVGGLFPSGGISGSTTICPGGNTQLSIQMTGQQPWSITWTDGVTPQTLTGLTLSPYVVTVTPSQTRTYSLSQISNACGNGSITGSAVVTISGLATATASGSGNVCPGGTATVSFTLTGNPPFQLSYSDGMNTNTVNGITGYTYQISVTPTQNTTYSPVGIIDGVCGAGSTSGSYALQILPAIANSGVLSGGGQICSGSTGTVTVQLAGTPPWNITYTNGGSPYTISGILSSTYTYSVYPATNPGTITLTGINNSTCGSGLATGSAQFFQVPPPTASISGLDSICAGTPVTLAIHLTGLPGLNFLYTNGSIPTSVTNVTTTPHYITVSPGVTTQYSLLGITGPLCNGTVTGTATVVVTPQPVAGFIPTITGGLVTIQNTSTGASGFVWNFGDSTPITSGPSPTHTYVSNGTYSITLYAISSTCSDTLVQNVVITSVNREDLSDNFNFKVYPNPSSGEVNLSWENFEVNQIKAYNVAGKLIYDSSLNIEEYSKVYMLDFKGHPAGIYELQVIGKEGQITRRIQITH